MKALLEAVHAALSGGGALGALASGGVHAGLAPLGSEPPYLVWELVGERAGEGDTGGRVITTATVRFDFLSTSSAGAAAGGDAVEALFAGAVLALDEGEFIRALCRRRGFQLERAERRGEEVWRSRVEIEFTVQRQPGA